MGKNNLGYIGSGKDLWCLCCDVLENCCYCLGIVWFDDLLFCWYGCVIEWSFYIFYWEYVVLISGFFCVGDGCGGGVSGDNGNDLWFVGYDVG